jgi:predicted alpha-1,2-mannosidase
MKNGTTESPFGFNRRSFLKSSGLAAAAAALLTEAAEAETPPRARTPTGAKRTVSPNPLELVNVLQGTASEREFSRGNTLPIASVPFGMAHWTLQSRANSPWMFDPGERRLQGLRCTHQLSPWLADYGHAVFLPFAGDLDPDPQMRSSSWRPEKSTLLPHSFKLTLLRFQAEVEVIPSERCAALSTEFSGNAPAGFLIDCPGHDDTFHFDQAAREIRFESRANAGGVPPNFATYYVVRFADAWESVTTQQAGTSVIGMVRFKSNRSVEARIATSFISHEQARRNLDRELGSKSLAELRTAAAAHWNQYFDAVEIEGGSDTEERIFYSCLYRVLLFPRTFHEYDADGKPQHFSAYNGKVVPGVMYADHGYWDVYRAWYPLMSIVYPERLAEILQAWVNAYTEGGWLPQFPAPGYRACMTGSLIDAVFGDAAAKGIQGFDLATAYAGLKKHATQPGDPDRGYGRSGIEDYLKLGYVAADHVPQALAETVDSAFGDFCIAQVARSLGNIEDAEMFLERSRNWRKVFDSSTGFLRGKLASGAWLDPFDEFQWGSPYVEGSAWQHRWDVPHDISGLIAALGGNARAVAVLDKMLALQPVFRVGVYGQEIHEMSEMAAVDFGQYAQSNQPSHHLLYIFALAGRPDRTQQWVRRTMADLYTIDAFPGDEDTGSMAAWYILSAFGFYPVCPGKPEYVLGSPLFDRVTLNLPGGRKTIIEARGQSSTAVYVSKLLVDDKLHTASSISHADISRGAHLTFFMQTSPAAEST